MLLSITLRDLSHYYMFIFFIKVKSLNHQGKVEDTVVTNDLKNLSGWQPLKFFFTLFLLVHSGVAANVLPGFSTLGPRLTQQLFSGTCTRGRCGRERRDITLVGASSSLGHHSCCFLPYFAGHIVIGQSLLLMGLGVKSSPKEGYQTCVNNLSQCQSLTTMLVIDLLLLFL